MILALEFNRRRQYVLWKKKYLKVDQSKKYFQKSTALNRSVASFTQKSACVLEKLEIFSAYTFKYIFGFASTA